MDNTSFFLMHKAEPLILSWWTQREHGCSLGNKEEFWRIQCSQNVEALPPLKRLIAWVGEKAQACRFSIYLTGRTCNSFLSQVFCHELAEGVNRSVPRLSLVRGSLTPFPSGLATLKKNINHRLKSLNYHTIANKNTSQRCNLTCY